MNLNDKKIATLAAFATEEKRGVDPVVLDLRSLSDAADYFVIVGGTSDRHVRTLAEAVIDRLREKKVKPHHVEGLNGSNWVLVDYGTVIVHVFHHETRTFYNLERLWGDAKKLTVKEKHEKKTKTSRRRSAAGHSRRS